MQVLIVAAFAILIFHLEAEDLPRLPAKTMGLIDGARGLAPEFSADLLLRLAGSLAIEDARWKVRLLEEAFVSGASAQLPYRKHGEMTTDARASRMFSANNLEALSLQTRAVEAMLALDPQRAREMFDDIPTPQVPALACGETGAPDLSAYYRTAADVFAKGFTAGQRRSSNHLYFLERIIGGMLSPAHVTPALNLIFEVSVTSGQREDLLTRFAGNLDHINGTARIFASSSSDLLAHFGDPTPVLIPALRAYIVRHVSGPRCSDDTVLQPSKLPFVVISFNSLVSKLDPTETRLKPITQDEAKPSKDEGTFPHHWWWQSKRSKQVLDALKWLNHGNRNLPDNKRFFTLEERMSNDWNAHFIDTLKLIEGWSADEEDSADDWFGMVSEAYELLAEKAPRDEQREGAMKRFLNFMETHYADIECHNLWFRQLKGQWASPDPWIADRMAESRNPAISLYARTARLVK
jgi:hypothetical protein